MNIFYVDENPVTAAQALCDKHVVKMCLETAQILCSVIGTHSQELQPPYKLTHKNHPCVLWAGLTPDNFDWTYKHGIALCDEYTYRYEKRHKSQDVIEWCGNNRISGPANGFTTPALAMPDEYKCSNAVEAYRTYYIKGKLPIIDCRWTKRDKPVWLMNNVLAGIDRGENND